MQPFAAYLRSLNPRLPREVWILQAGGLANAFGNGIVLPFLIIYLHNVRGFPLGIAGLVAATNSAVALCSGFLAGTLADRIGPRAVLMGSLVVMAGGISLFPLIRAEWHAFVLYGVVGAGSGAFWPSQSGLLTRLAPAARRHGAFALQRVSMNLGIALGGLTGGLIASSAHPSTYTILFLADALTFLAFFFVLWTVPAPALPEKREPGTYANVLRDRPFVSYILLNTVFIGAGMVMIVELLPPYAKNHVHVSESGIGTLWSVNSIVIVVAQLSVTKRSEGHRRMRGLALMGLLWAAAMLVILAAGLWLTAVAATVVLAAAVLVFGLGQCLHGTIHAPLAADLAPPHLLGRYMAFSSISWQIGWIVGPAGGGFVLQHAPNALWPAAAALNVAGAAWALALERRLPAAVRITQLGDSRAGQAGTMANMTLTTDEPLSTNAQPAAHPAEPPPHTGRGRRRASSDEAR